MDRSALREGCLLVCRRRWKRLSQRHGWSIIFSPLSRMLLIRRLVLRWLLILRWRLVLRWRRLLGWLLVLGCSHGFEGEPDGAFEGRVRLSLSSLLRG